MIEIFGYVERITFQNAENGFTVARLKQPRQQELTTIVGTMPTIQPGETIICYGEWKDHSTFGQQFTVERYQTKSPASLVAIQKYLESGMIKGIGSMYAKRVVKTFGLDTLNILEEAPDRLLEVEGIGQRRLNLIKKSWSEHRAIRDVMLFLQEYNVSPAFAQKIFRNYGENSVVKIKENPYQLARDIFGIGFKTADTLAQKMGIPANSPQRITAGIEYVLNELSSEGHVCYPVEDFIPIAQKTLESTDDNIIRELLKALEADARIVQLPLTYEGKLQTFIWLKSLYIAESGISKELHRLLHSPCNLRSLNVDQSLDWVQQELNIQLAANQKLAVTQALTEKVQVITGGPGTGKSTITHAILTISSTLTSNILLAAPTGRAAKRMSEITGKNASTIHSLLEYDFTQGGFKRNRKNPLKCDLLIVDESSMIDTMLMYNLLKAIPSGSRVIFVGDINQLPSVGPGNVLKNFIECEQLPVTILTEIFRQAAGSKIVTNAHRINTGEFPDISGGSTSDFFFMNAETPEEVLDILKGVVCFRLPKKYNFDPINEIQVLAPMKRGVVGTINLNTELQKILNPSTDPLIHAAREFHVGDKVMQIRNNYDKEIFNGDVGRIIEIDRDTNEILVNFESKEVAYDLSDLDELVLAYAVSIHKYQGSECPCIVVPVHTTHFLMLHRNLLYTAVTRGKKLVVLIGNKKALAIAVKNDTVKQRYSGLFQFLVEMGSFATQEHQSYKSPQIPF
ncbi:MAG: recd1 [Chlamydiales bacterium]|jgi:exodeoxyribonuclease V alpha subunit|nr:recd1 [Chlamydiales bacterium]